MDSVQAKPRLRVVSRVATGSSEETVYTLADGSSTIGRSHDNTIVLHDSLVSRQHAEITFDGRSAFLRDVGGKNPLRVNGRDVSNHQLQNGDRISIGQTELVFEFQRVVPRASRGDNGDHPEGDYTETPLQPLRVISGRTGETRSGIRPLTLEEATKALDNPDLTDVPSVRKSYERLRSLYLFSERILRITDPEELYDHILNTATGQTGAERGFLGVATEGQEEDPYSLNIVRFWNSEQENRADMLEMSETILYQIQRERKAVLVRDVPERRDFGMSVIDLKIRSFLCAPLLSGERFLGLIYVDTRGAREQFTVSDLQFVSAVGHIAGLSLENLHNKSSLQRENEKLRSLVGGGQELVGSSEVVQRVLTVIEKVAPRDTSVLINGENGTGKELVARAIHNKSPRRDAPFVAVNCGAVPPNLVESELFGFEKGAFTGAVRTTEGKFELAAGGTLFLDEVGEMPLDMQVKILRALQEKNFYRVGGKQEISVDFRVLAATNSSLKQAIENGRFREDLYFRLAVVTIDLPPLRDRGDDVLEIADYFLQEGSNPIVLTKAARECLLKYSWPGNIRELRNALEQAVILGNGRKITPSDLPPKIVKEARGGKMVFRLKPLGEVERQYILRVLEETDGNKVRAASILGISRETLYQKLKSYQKS